MSGKVTFQGRTLSGRQKNVRKKNTGRASGKADGPHAGGRPNKPGQNTAAKVKLEELAIFVNQFAVLLRSGVPLVSVLNMLVEQTDNKPFREVLAHIRDQVSEGMPLSEAFAGYRRIFPQILISLVRAGEMGGDMAGILLQAGEYLKKQDEIEKKIRSALVYPRFVFIFFLFILAAVIYGLVPKFRETFSTFGSELPPVTEMLMATSEFATRYFYWEVGFFALLFISYKHIKKQPAGKRFFDGLQFRLPVFGPLMLKGTVSRFCNTLRVLMENGITFVDALELAGETSGNVVFREVLGRIRNDVIEGSTLAAALSRQQLIPDAAVRMIATGEQAGSIGPMLQNVVELYDNEIETRINSISTVIEPVMMIGLGVIALIVILALYLPIFNLGNLSY